jgi:serine/threonine protein kinase
MAPEIVKLIGQSRQERDGYTRAVDWWGLGVTTYKMLTGRMPFTAPAQPRFAALRGRTSDYEVLMQTVEYPAYVEESAKVTVGPTVGQTVGSTAFVTSKSVAAAHLQNKPCLLAVLQCTETAVCEDAPQELAHMSLCVTACVYTCKQALCVVISSMPCTAVIGTMGTDTH